MLYAGVSPVRGEVATAMAESPTAAAINIPAAPGFNGLTTIQAVERLSNYGNIYKSIIGQINQGASAGTIGSSRAGQLRATVSARIQQMNANYFAWRDAYDDSVSPGSGDSGGKGGGGGGGSGSGSETGGDSGSGSGSGNLATTGAPGAGKTDSPGTGKTRRKSGGGKSPGGGHGSTPAPPDATRRKPDGGVRSGTGSRGSNATLRAAATPAVANDASSDRKQSSSAGSGGDGTSLVDEMRRRATVSRAVDAVPLGLRLMLLALLFTIAMLSAISLRERRRARNVERVSQLDYLTGLANREGFDRMLALEWRRAARYGRPLGLIFVDLDHFKLYNDTYGHLAGDRLLRQVAAAIGETARGSDFTARLGGDEFVILCPEATDDGLESLRDRLRDEVSSIEVTLSIGWALQRPDDLTPDDLVSRADAAMYRSKDRRRRPVSVGNPMLGSLRRSPLD